MKARDFYNTDYDQFLVLSHEDIHGKLERVYRFAEAYHKHMRKAEDDPMADCTAFAHPAWWRGQEHAYLQFVTMVNKILDGEPASGGLSTEPWQSLRQRLYDLRTLLGIAERIVGQVKYDHNSKFYLNISQWYKVRQDYARRRKDAERS